MKLYLINAENIYFPKVKEYFRDAAQQDADENYKPEPDWDMMPGGYDYDR